MVKFFKFSLLSIILVGILGLTACNTVAGAGRDVDAIGHGVSSGARGAAAGVRGGGY